MFGMREAGVLGASVALAGGVAYLIWNYASFSGLKKPESRPGEGERSVGEGGEGENKEVEEEEREETKAEASVVVAAEAQQVSEVKM